jgi:hypothetical protein
MKKNILTFICTVLFSMSHLFSLQAHSLSYAQPKSKSFDTGIYLTKNGLLNINVIKDNMDTPTVIKFTNPHGKVIHMEKVSKRNKKFAMQLDMNFLIPGEYALSVSSNGESQIKSITISAPVADKTIVIH